MFRALFLGTALIALIVACAGYALLAEITRPAASSGAPVTIAVEPGDSTSAIATKLAEAKLIRQPLLFTLLVRFRNLDGALQAGNYQLDPTMTMSEIVATLQQSQISEVQVRVAEGMRLEEIAQLMGSAGINGVTEQGFLDATKRVDAFRPNHFLLGSVPVDGTLNGYLFPDTYRFSTTATVTDVIETMLTNFDQQYASFEQEVYVNERTVHEIVTMASIVQREAAQEAEMPKIAAVFWNRLKPEHAAETGNGRLQADPTVQYALGETGNWWPNLSSLTTDQIDAIESPYNTRINPGLPPNPISNPGLAALRAAAQPDESQAYLYFVVSCTAPGTHNFATTFEEFRRYEDEYLQCTQP